MYLESELPKRERKRLLRQRSEAYAQVIDAMSSKRFQLLMIDLMAWIRLGEWRTGKRASRPFPMLAERRISRLWLKISSHGDLRAMAPEERHQLRIEAKKLRYALEFAHALHAGAGSRLKQFARAIETLQEALGRLNDIVTARRLAVEEECGISARGSER